MARDRLRAQAEADLRAGLERWVGVLHCRAAGLRAGGPEWWAGMLCCRAAELLWQAL